MTKLKAVLLLLIFNAITFTSIYSQIASKDLDTLVADAMKKFNVEGVAVGIVKDGKVIHLKGYGLKKVGTNEKVDEYTNFAIGSTSKAFTTTALSILEDEGKIEWNDKVVRYIPEFKMYNDYVTSNFTIEDLLTHRSGVGSGEGDSAFPLVQFLRSQFVTLNCCFMLFVRISAPRAQGSHSAVWVLPSHRGNRLPDRAHL